ncbi:MAG TPA: nucleotide exchange factor GrpE [Pyrinomonadaceae bacterium]|nr:nucleotide exchange factor GrpE [Pyrinomonadaceae bacterium]
MRENSVSGRERGDEPETSPEGEVRVTDRRRVNLDGESNAGPVMDETGEAAAGQKPAYVEEIEERARGAERKLAEVQSRFEQLRSQLQRETDETRQRLNRSAEERTRREKAEFINALLPVLDNLRRALEAAEANHSLDALLDGVRGTASNFESALQAAGVETMRAVGTNFDPELHEAVDTVEVEPEQEGIVTAEYSSGYRMGDKLLRPARVQVGRARGEAKKAAE